MLRYWIFLTFHVHTKTSSGGHFLPSETGLLDLIVFFKVCHMCYSVFTGFVCLETILRFLKPIPFLFPCGQGLKDMNDSLFE